MIEQTLIEKALDTLKEIEKVMSNWEIGTAEWTSSWNMKYKNLNKKSIISRIAFNTNRTVGNFFADSLKIFIKFNSHEKAQSCLNEIKLLYYSKIQKDYSEELSDVFDTLWDTDSHSKESVVCISFPKSEKGIKDILKFLEYINRWIEQINPEDVRKSMNRILDKQKNLIFFYQAIKACNEGDLKALNELFKNGEIDANLKELGDCGESLITACSRSGKLECIQFLIEKCKAKITPLDSYQYSPFHIDKPITKSDLRGVIKRHNFR